VLSERPANLNSEIPACITKESVPKVTPSYQAGHEPMMVGRGLMPRHWKFSSGPGLMWKVM
jgi:hypothetical protein